MEKNRQKIIIAAGGTGGHLYPGIALAATLRERGCEPLFIVREQDACREILEENGFPYREIPASGLPRRLSPKLFVFAARFVRGLFRTLALLSEERPAAVVGMGGYISFPAVVLGRLKGIPSFIHEQNCLPGLANRILGRVARRVAISFEEARPFFPARKTVLTGNPVRPDLFAEPAPEAYGQLNLDPEKFTVFIFGGSQGAAGLNRAVVESSHFLGAHSGMFQFIHIAGKQNEAALRKAYRDNGIPGQVLPYLHRIGLAYTAADLIVCRAGATTIAELMILNKPAILVPFPHATGDHQSFNAAALVRKGKATMVREENLSAHILAGLISGHIQRFRGHVNDLRIPDVYPQQLLADLVLNRP